MREIMTGRAIRRSDLDEIIELVEATRHLAEFQLKYGDFELRLSRAADEAPTKPVPARAPTADAVAIRSTLVGSCHRAQTRGGQPFVEVGQAVQADSVVCVIEVMRRMHPVLAGVAGTVRDVSVGDGEAVQFGQVLAVIDPALQHRPPRRNMEGG